MVWTIFVCVFILVAIVLVYDMGVAKGKHSERMLMLKILRDMTLEDGTSTEKYSLICTKLVMLEAYRKEWHK